MGRLIGAIASVVIGLALAVGIAFALPAVVGPDNNVDFVNTESPVNANGEVSYGSP